MISIVCACNNQKVLNELLVASLEKQNCKDYELIVVDAKKLGFKSASETLNYGFSLAKGDIVLFAHQDIEFLEQNALEHIIELSNNYEYGIAGVAGATGEKKFQVSSTVTMGDSRRQAGQRISEVKQCYSLDECLLIVKKDSFQYFDDLGNTWHFYGVEYSHRCLAEDKKVLLFPVSIYHASAANSLDKTYFDTLKRYGKKHKDIKLIRTCCGYFNNNILLGIYCLYRKFKLLIKRLIVRKILKNNKIST